MRYFLAFSVMAASLALGPIAAADDDNDLFSEVAMEFAYASDSPAKLNDSEEKPEQLPTRVTGSTSLMELLKAAGLEPTKVSNQTARVKLRSAGWNLQANFTTSVQQDRLTITIPLAKIDNESTMDHAKLLRLLSVGRGENAVFFAYDNANGMIELRRLMTNRGLTAGRLKHELEDLADVAQQHESDWSTVSKAKKTQPKTAKTPTNTQEITSPKPTNRTQPSPKRVSSPKLTLAGTWSASLGAGEAFAIQINRDTTFRLVHVKSGKSVASTGKAARSGNQLTLNGDDGTKIVGTVRQTTANAFQLVLSGATLNFKKAN